MAKQAPHQLTLSPTHTSLITWSLLFLLPIVGMAIDITAPSLPSIAVSLHSTNKLAKDAISIYLLGYALGNFLTGSATDSFGRKMLLRLGLLSFIVISLVPPLFPNMKVLLAARFLQGVSLGAVALIARAIFADILPPEKLVRLGTLIGTMWGLGPVIGPVIGGYLQYYFGWQSIFYFLAALALIEMIAIVIIIPETHLHRQLFNFATIKNNFKATIVHRQFMGFVIIMGLAYALIIIFQTAGPFLIQNRLHQTPVYFGHIAMTLGIMFLVSTFCCRHFIKKYSVATLYFYSINILLLVAILGFLLSYFFLVNIYYITLISACMFFACGFMFPMSMGQGIAFFRHIAGTASATMYLINISITSLASYLIGFVEMDTAVPMMLAYLVIALMCTIVYWTMIYEPGNRERNINK